LKFLTHLVPLITKIDNEKLRSVTGSYVTIQSSLIVWFLWEC